MRKWTPEQREQQQRKMRAFHKRKRTGAGGRVVDLTLSDLPQLLEGHELCERIGWDLVRQLAARLVS